MPYLKNEEIKITTITEAVDKDSQDKLAYKNFTVLERLATVCLNIPGTGIGSLLIMDDLTGATIQWGLFGSGAVLMTLGVVTRWNILLVAGSVSLSFNFYYSIYRSLTYDKPHSLAYNKHEGFSFAVIPNKYGNLLPAVTFNKEF